mgnify:CR=1 FL=1
MIVRALSTTIFPLVGISMTYDGGGGGVGFGSGSGGGAGTG